jgi:hypothetical protein
VRWVVRSPSLAFVETVKNDLGVKATHREVLPADGTYALREASEPYVRKFTGKNEVLRAENTFFRDENGATAET